MNLCTAGVPLFASTCSPLTTEAAIATLGTTQQLKAKRDSGSTAAIWVMGGISLFRTETKQYDVRKT